MEGKTMSGLLTERARELRKTMTDAERRLWRRLREQQLGARFRRQAPVGPYIVDFVSFQHRLIIELDGSQHAEAAQAAYDSSRTAFLEAEGFQVLRFWNNQVIENPDGVLERIYEQLRVNSGGTGKKKPPHPVPPPRGGRGRNTGA